MRRILLILAGTASALTASAVPAAASTTAAATFCVPASAATYRHTFDGANGIATITAVRPLCSGQTQPFSLVSYTAGGFPAAGQFIYDSDGATIGSSRRSVTLTVAVPACYTQVQAIIGTAVRTETTSSAAPYGDTMLGSAIGAGRRSTGWPARYAGGTTACTIAPRVTFTNACDGTLTASLTNGDSADVRAVFLTGSRRIRLSPGRFTTVKAAKGRTLTIRDSSFVTHVGTWRTPTAGCASPTTAPPRNVALPAPASTATREAVELAAPADGDGRPAEFPAAGSSADPAALTRTPPATLARPGMPTGSIVTIVVGFLMIGGGLAVLTRLVRRARRSA